MIRLRTPSRAKSSQRLTCLTVELFPFYISHFLLENRSGWALLDRGPNGIASNLHFPIQVALVTL